ncbi:MAG: saccharopine dehydrogenase NADP-binding domain-containing protein, partial [Bacteroidota bacterium]|nr:saccharopine dehydrogenase NADP-binding domain-containing protein [Bacteroidota bacterium]
MKKLVVFGAGKSATCLIDYLAAAAARYDWSMTVADGDTHTVTEKTKAWPHVKPVALNVTDGVLRQLLVQEADIVISLLPPSLHFLLAQDCLQFGKHLLTASYTDDAIRALAPAIREKGLLFLCEMGLDPGIDHMSALEMIRRIQADGGHIKSFSSHCGGLVAPESDNNPWHYKISWNPRNVVMAGKAGAQYRQDGKTAALDYKSLFQSNRTVNIPGLGPLAYYPNRDSLGYIPLYGLESADDFIRTTLRYPGFCSGWKHIVDLQLTDETIVYDTDGMSLQQFFSQHFDRFKLGAAYDKLISAEPLFRVQMEYLGTG